MRGRKGRLEEVKRALRALTPPVNVMVSRAPSTRVDFERRGIDEVLRASVHYYNDESDVGALIQGLRAVLGA